MSTIFPFIEKVKFGIAEKVSPIKNPTISSFDLMDLEMSAPKMYSIGELLLHTQIIEEDLSDFGFKPLVKDIRLFESLDVLETNIVYDLNEIKIIDVEIESFKIYIEGKDYQKRILPKQTSLFSDDEIDFKSNSTNSLKIERRYKNNDELEPFNIFDIIFPSLQPPLGINYNNTISFFKPLYPFQVDGVKFLISNKSVLLGDEMGLGKSIQTITAARFLFREGKINSCCILCPKAVLTDWEKKIWDWAPELKVVKISGERNQREVLWNTPSHFYVCTYETILKDIEDNEFLDVYNEKNERHKANFGLIVYDEIQKTKNPQSKTTKAIRSLKSYYKWGLSGTPLENKVEDLIAICETIKPGIFKNCHLDNISEIIETYKPIFLRRKKEDALIDLPPKETEEIWLDLSSNQRITYDLAEKEGLFELESKGEFLNLTYILALINKLKQICNYDISSDESIKLEYLIDDLEIITEEGRKALVFSQFPNQTLKKLLPALSDFNPIIYDGSLSDIQRSKIIDDFQSNPECKVLLISLKAGNSGITLTNANYVFQFDLWWNPAMSAQAVDRAHRIGQKNTVFEKILLTNNTIEERIFEILKGKKKLFNDIVDNLSDTELLTETLTEKEIYSLFGLKKKVSFKKSETDLRSIDVNDLNPIDFEIFVSDLFEKMNYNTKLTKKSRDGGIDIHVKLNTPTGINEMVIQCKHKENENSIVGVDKVRELYGVVSSNSRFTRGMLVTNGRFSNDSIEFANGKNIDLIDGLILRGYIEKYT
jgi:SNF2 family DNA or RNA helicase